MSWAEYKKKREEQEKSKTSSYQEYNNSNNNSEVSSWQRYKQIREEQEQQQKEITNITRSSAIAPIKTTANLSDTELRKIEKNAGLKAGVLNLNQVQSQQQNFENLQQKGNEILQDKKSDLGIDNGKILKKSSAFKDGYNFGDVSKTALSTAGDVALNIGKGIMNIGEGIGDLATYGIAGIADLTGNKEYAEKLRYNASHMNVVDDMTKPMINAVDKNSILGNKSDEVAQGLGYVAGNTAIAVASGGLGTKLGLSSKIAQTAGSMGTTFTSSMGHGMTEAYQNGATDDEAFAYGLISGVGETGSELMFGGLGKASKAVGLSKGAGELDDIVIGGLTKNIKNKMAKTLVQSGLKATGEGAEEVVSGLISAVGKKVTYMSEEELGQILKDENLAEQFWMGALTSAIAQAPSTMSSIKNGTDYITGEKYNEFQKNDAQKLAQNVQNSTEQQTILNDMKMSQNENTAQLDDMLNNKELPMQNYIYEKSNNTKIDNLRKDASRYFNNLEKTHNYMQMLEKVIEDKNIDIRFNADLKTPDGKIANGSYSNGVITINPNSTRTGEFIAIHELTHAIGTDSMKNIIETYKKSNPEFNTAVEKLLQNYNSTEITEEALSDVSAQLFGNQEFINNVAQTNPNIFQKIYSEIKYLWHQFRGYKNQNQFIEDLYYKWTQAYNSNNKLNNSENYLITQNNKGKYVKADRQVITGNNPLEWETQVENYINDNIRQGKDVQVTTENGDILTITKDTSGKAKFRNQITDKYGNTRYLNNKEFLSKLTAETHIDELAQISQKINKNPIPDYKKHKFAKDGFDYRSAYFEDFDGQYYKITMSVGKNGDIDTIYNIGKMDKKNRSKSSLVAQRPSDKNITSNEELTSTNSIPSSNKDVNTTTKYSIQESENNTQLSEEAKKQLHRYIYMNKEQLNKAFSEAIENKENMLQEYNTLSQEYKNFQKTEEFMKALENGDLDSNAWNKAGKYADKLRCYNEQYEKYKAQQEAINSLLMDNQTETRSIEQVAEEAEKHFGTTTNFKETAYIDVNGKQIDFSGKHEGGPSGTRTLDHRQINEIDIDMDSFINMGNIRVLPEGGGINLSIEPNPKQYSKLKEYIDSVNGEIYIDIDKSNHAYDSAEYKAGTSTDRILSDLQYYFKNGKFPTKSQFADFRYSQNTPTWQQYLDKNFKPTGTRTNMQDILVSKATNKESFTQKQYIEQTSNTETTQRNRNKTMNPTEIANLKPENANTTPQLKKKTYKKGNKQSSFLSNIVMDSKFLNEDLRQEMSKEDSIKYYEGITNKGTLESAYNKLQRNGQEEVIKWHTKDSKNATAEDVATGWILLKQYQDNGDYQSAVEVAKKMRDIGTTAGQTVQAYNILSRLTPEGMFYYAQSELDEAYNRMVEGKSKKWIEENQSKFNLTPEETQSILDIMKDVSTMEDGYNKKVKLAEIQKIITDKIPPTAGQSIKAWMRISMLFNPKTQVRNVMGNAVITPINMFSDSISAGIDKIISKKTGVRTTGNINLKNYGKGFGTGLYQSYNDFKKGINTRNIEGNRFEISEGRSFKNKGIGKALNRVDNLLSFMLDAGDRGFYEATFTNSINNQMLLNKVDTPTQDMIDIATTEALQRTWQDNNKYTQSVLKIRNILNNANIKGYGLGDVLIPFAKTPANLTKAIVDYSPAGLVKTLVKDARILKNSLGNGQYTAQVQHRFVQNLGKGMAGTFLYVLSYGLAKAGIATGESDDDKDVKNFMKNSLGISSYSIKIGDKTFSYDWAQPIATPLAIMTNYVKYSKENPDTNILEKGISAMNIGTEQLLQQSFMESLNTVLNGNGTTLENLSQAILDLPARAIPTFSKQIADMVDGTQRTTFEYSRPIKSAVNSVVAKIPVASKTLPASVDTLGNEIQKYGGNNNLWNVMLNPANTNKGHLSKSGEEIYNIYKETGDKTIFPRTAPYYINNKNEKVTMTAEQRNKFQTISGKYVESSLNNLLRDKEYQKLSIEEKANIINEIVSDSYSKAKYDVLNIDSKEYEKLRNTLKNVSASSYYNYKFKTKDMKKDIEKIKVLASSDYDNKEKTALYEQYILSTEDKKYPIVKTTNIDITQYLQYKLAESNKEFKADREDDGTVTGKSVSGSAKQKRWQYIENMNITYTQKLILYGLECTPNDSQQRQIINYVKSLPNKTNKEKLEILSQFKGFTIYKDGSVKY